MDINEKQLAKEEKEASLNKSLRCAYRELELHLRPDDNEDMALGEGELNSVLKTLTIIDRLEDKLNMISFSEAKSQRIPNLRDATLE